MRGASRRGFTLVEALAAAVLLGVGIAGVLGGFSAIAVAEGRARETEAMQRLAIEKLDEMQAITQTFTTGESGDFSDRNMPEYAWEMQVDSTGIENLEAVTVRVNRANGTDSDPQGVASVLVFQPPAPAEVPEQ